MNERQLRDEAMTLYLAGHETTALTLAWTWYLLSKHPQVEEKLVSEWQPVLRGANPKPEHIPLLPYTAAVITESMRLFPPVYVIGREATIDLELGGYRVKRGYTVLMSQWVSHRDPKYFPEPEEFRPERWENGLARRLPKFAYFPFGGGPRICVGGSFAFMEASIILAAVGQRYRFTLGPCGDRHQAADHIAAGKWHSRYSRAARIMRSVLITGASSGIGLATAMVLSSRGWHVFATMRNLQKRSGLEQALRAAGVQKTVEIEELDVTSSASIQTATASILARPGHKLEKTGTARQNLMARITHYNKQVPERSVMAAPP